MKQHFLQSPAWEKYQQLEGYTTYRLSGDDFSALLIEHSTPLGKYLFCPYGPTVKSPASLPAALSALQEFARAHAAFFLRIEPTFPLSSDDIRSLHLVKSHDLDPAHTWILDLTSPESDILDGIDKEKRRLWRIRERKGVTLRHTTDPSETTILTDLLAAVTDKNHFTAQTASHLKNQLKSGFATLYIAEFEHKPIAAALVYDHSGTRFYAHAAADYEHRKLSAGATLVIQMILDAKSSGATAFDFWGITPSDDPHHPWYGFTKFKKSFGGHAVDYAGTWDLPLQPLRYKLYQFIRLLNRFTRKLRR